MQATQLVGSMAHIDCQDFTGRLLATWVYPAQNGRLVAPIRLDAIRASGIYLMEVRDQTQVCAARLELHR